MHVGRRDLDDATERRDQDVEILDVLGDDLQAVAGGILSEQHAVAIVDEPSGRRQGHDLHPIVLGERAEVLVLRHLELKHPQHQNQGQSEDSEARGDDPALEEPSLAGDILDCEDGDHAT